MVGFGWILACNAASSLNLGHIIADIQISNDLQSYSCKSSCLARHLGACTVAVVVVRVMHWVMGLGGWLSASRLGAVIVTNPK